MLTSILGTGSNAGTLETLISQFTAAAMTPASAGPVLDIGPVSEGSNVGFTAYHFQPAALAQEEDFDINLAAYDSAQNLAISTWDTSTSMWEALYYPPSVTNAFATYPPLALPAPFGYIELSGEPIDMVSVPPAVYTTPQVTPLVISPSRSVTVNYYPGNYFCNGGSGPDTTNGCQGDVNLTFSGGTPPYTFYGTSGSCYAGVYTYGSHTNATGAQVIPSQFGGSSGGYCAGAVTDSSSPPQSVTISVTAIGAQ